MSSATQIHTKLYYLLLREENSVQIVENSQTRTVGEHHMRLYGVR